MIARAASSNRFCSWTAGPLAPTVLLGPLAHGPLAHGPLGRSGRSGRSAPAPSSRTYFFLLLLEIGVQGFTFVFEGTVKVVEVRRNFT